MTKIETGMLVAFSFLLIIAGCNENNNPPPPQPPPPIPGGGISMNPQSWNIGPTINNVDFSVGMPAHPSGVGAGWYFDFPSACNKTPDCSVHYVSTSPSGLKPTQSVTASFTIAASADAVFNCAIIKNNPEGYNLADLPETNLYLQRVGDDWSGVAGYEYYRYYAYPERIALSSGSYSLTVPLTPDKWISVLGKPGDVNFAAALSNLGNIGLVFGGCGYAGHGVQMSQGTARFTLTGFAIK